MVAWQGKFFFLTYTHCGSHQDELYTHLNSKRPIRRAVIVRESHADGEPHLHAAIEFESRVQTTNARYFDFGQHHPNVQRVRSWGASVNYCRKDGGDETRYYGCTAEDATGPSTAEGTHFDAAAACAESATRVDWLTTALKHDIPYGYADAFWRAIKGRKTPTIFERPVGDELGIINNFELSIRRFGETDRTVCILGPSGCGKTTWAKREAPLPFLFVTHIDNLGDYDPEVHKSIVFDEIDFSGGDDGKGRWPLKSQIKLVTWDDPMSHHLRYKVAHIPRHVPKIFTCCDNYCFTKDPQIKRRVKFINLYDDLDDSIRWR